MAVQRVILILMLAGLASSAFPSPAEAIPSFARKYGISCSVCHDPVPRLTAFGDQFAANGFEMMVGEEPRDTIDTGDSLLTLLRQIDLAFRLDAYVSASEPIGADATRVDLQTPYNIKMLTGGPIADKISYYMYFFLAERGEVVGLEDAYIQFTDIGGTGVSLIAGQFQVSDPMFKRELRLPVEDYHLYRVRVGEVGADLTYDRGLFATYDPWRGAGASLMVVNGSGLNQAGTDRLYDRDAFKSVALHLSQELGPVRIGAFGYAGREGVGGERDRILIFGPDATVTLGRTTELNLQFLRRTDTNPLLTPTGPESTVDSFMGELILGPHGRDGRWYGTALLNWIDSDQPFISLRTGEQSVDDGFIQKYSSVSGAAHYLLRRNVRLVGEVGWDIERDSPEVTIGTTLAW